MTIYELINDVDAARDFQAFALEYVALATRRAANREFSGGMRLKRTGRNRVPGYEILYNGQSLYGVMDKSAAYGQMQRCALAYFCNEAGQSRMTLLRSKGLI